MIHKFLVPTGRTVSFHFLYYRLVLNFVSSENKGRDSGCREEYLDFKREEVPRKWNNIKHTFTVDTCCLKLLKF
jgi:hypothetical protein